MKIKFFCPRWGAEQLEWDQFLTAVKEAGYAGIEWFPYAEKGDYAAVVRLLENYNLEYTIVMAVIERIDDFEQYLRELENRLLRLCRLGGTKKPLVISAQTGREFYTEEQ